MNIWIVNQYAIFANEVGSTRHYDFTKEILSQGHKVKIITSDFNHYSHTKRNRNSSTELDHEMITVPSYKGNGVDRILNMIVFTCKLFKFFFYPKTRLPDVIIASSPHLFAPYLMMKIAQFRRIQFILEIRDIWPLSIVVLGKFKYSNPLIRIMSFLEKSLYKNSNKIITLLPSSIDYISQIRGNTTGILWLPNGIKQENLLGVLESQALHKTHEKKLIYAGSHGVANDIYSLLAAIRIFNEEKPMNTLIVELIGQGQEKEKLIEYKKQHKIYNVFFSDPVPKRDLFNKLVKADYFWVGSNKSILYKHGVSPNKLFDYMAVGKPILYSCDDGGPLINKHNCGLKAEASNPLDISKKLIELYEMDTAKLNQMGQNGKKAAIDEYNIKTLSDKLLNFIST